MSQQRALLAVQGHGVTPSGPTAPYKATAKPLWVKSQNSSHTQVEGHHA